MHKFLNKFKIIYYCLYILPDTNQTETTAIPGRKKDCII